MTLKDQIQYYFKTRHYDKAFMLLRSKTKDRIVINEIYETEGNFSHIQAQHTLGHLNNKDYDVALNGIRRAIFYIIDTHELDGNMLRDELKRYSYGGVAITIAIIIGIVTYMYYSPSSNMISKISLEPVPAQPKATPVSQDSDKIGNSNPFPLPLDTCKCNNSKAIPENDKIGDFAVVISSESVSMDIAIDSYKQLKKKLKDKYPNASYGETANSVCFYIDVKKTFNEAIYLANCIICNNQSLANHSGAKAFVIPKSTIKPYSKKSQIINYDGIFEDTDSTGIQ
jgi:hypothetical protein